MRLLKLVLAPECLSDQSLYNDDSYDSEECEHAGRFRANLRDVNFDLQLERAKDQARVAANLVFGSLVPYCPWFTALAVQLNLGDGERIHCAEYVRLRQIDVFGNMSYVGHEVEEGTLKYYEPCSDVLESVEDDGLLKYG